MCPIGRIEPGVKEKECLFICMVSCFPFRLVESKKIRDDAFSLGVKPPN